MYVTYRLDKHYDEICTKTAQVCKKYIPEYDGKWVYVVDSKLIGFIYFRNSKTGEEFHPYLIYAF